VKGLLSTKRKVARELDTLEGGKQLWICVSVVSLLFQKNCQKEMKYTEQYRPEKKNNPFVLH